MMALQLLKEEKVAFGLEAFPVCSPVTLRLEAYDHLSCYILFQFVQAKVTVLNAINKGNYK
jgi:hypothetical protein